MLEYGGFAFVHGEEVNQPFQAGEGWVVVVSDVRLFEQCVYLDDFAIWPLHTKHMNLPLGTLFELRQALSQQASRQGYNTIELTGLRLAELRPKRTFHYRWSVG